MSNVNFLPTLQCELSRQEFKLIGLALAAAAKGEPVKSAKDREEMRLLNQRLQNVYLRQLQEETERIAGAAQKAMDIPSILAPKEGETE